MARMRTVVVVVGLVALVAACGTQLPDKDFHPVVLAQGATQQSAGPVASAGEASPGQDLAVPAASGAVATTGAVAPGLVGPAAPLASAAPQGARASAATSSGHSGAVARPTSAGASAPAGALTASDVGVTATTITLGNIVSAGGIFGTEQFGVSKYGAQAYFAWLNAHGGVEGRKVVLDTYNDNGDGSQNVSQVKQAVETDKVFAFVGNNIYSYDGAGEVQSAGVPDIGGQQISNVYLKYSHLFPFGGTNVPRDNKQTGFNGHSYGTEEFGDFYKQHIGGSTVGLVYYDQQASKEGADVFKQSYEAGGYKVIEYPVNLGLPNFSNTVAQMQSDGVDVVGDAMDDNGNEKLCQAMESNSSFISSVKAKITTVGSWNQRIPAEYKNTPKCRSLIVAGGGSRAYSDTSDSDVATFRAEMKKDFPQRESLMAQWSFEGWIAGEIFTLAAKSCGVNLTRSCVETFLNRKGVLLDPGKDTTGMSWDARPESTYTAPGASARNCVSAARWTESTSTWTPIGDPEKDCYTTGYYSYQVE